MISIRDRIIAATVLENAVGAPIFRDERVNLGFYKEDSPIDVANELQVAMHLFCKAFRTFDNDGLEKTFTYSPVTPAKVTILWAGAQAVHESEHHLSDVKENLELLRNEVRG